MVSVLPYKQGKFTILHIIALRIQYRNGIDNTKVVLEKILIWILVLPILAAAPGYKNILNPFGQGFTLPVRI